MPKKGWMRPSGGREGTRGDNGTLRPLGVLPGLSGAVPTAQSRAVTTKGDALSSLGQGNLFFRGEIWGGLIRPVGSTALQQRGSPCTPRLLFS